MGEIPTRAVSAIVAFVLWTSLGYLASVMVPRRGATSEQRNFAIVIVLGVFVLNPLICGALSEPFARYEARVVWLVPFAAGLSCCQSSVPLAVERMYNRFKKNAP
jgi:hypothetical protein